MTVFPTTSTLDAFTRANGTLGSNWGIVSGYSQLFVSSNQCGGAPSPAFSYWTTQYGADQEVFADVVGSAQVLYLGLRISNPTTSPTGYYVKFATNTWAVYKFDGTLLDSGTLSAAIAAGDKIGAAAVSSTITIWFYDASGGAAWVSQDTVTDSTYSSAGYIALGYANTASPVTVAVVDETPPVTLPLGGNVTRDNNTASGNGAATFVIDCEAEKDSPVLGCTMGAGIFNDSYITGSLTAGTNYTEFVDVQSATFTQSLSTSVSRVGGLTGANIATPGLYTYSFLGSQWITGFYDQFFVRAETPNGGGVDTATIAGTWRVQVFPTASLSGIIALADNFGGGAATVALTGATITGTQCTQHIYGSATLTGATVPASGVGSITYAWSPEPDDGQGTNTAEYDTFDTLGINLITLTVTNIQNSASVIYPVMVWGSALLDIIDALVAADVTFETVQGQDLTPTALGPENLPKSLDGYQLPVRLIMPADENLEGANFGFIAIGRSARADWSIVDLMLLKPVDSDLGLHGGAARDIASYAKEYVEMLVGLRSPTGQSYIADSTTTIQTGVFEYPPRSSRAYYGVLCTLRVNELISGCGG